MTTTDVKTDPTMDASPTTPRLGLGWVGITVRAMVAIAILLIGILSMTLVASVVGQIPGMKDGGILAIVVFILLHVGTSAVVVLAVWAWMRFVERRPLRTAGWSWNAASAGWLALAVAVSGGLVLAANAVLPATGPALGLASLGTYPPAGLAIVVVISQAFFLQAIPEELLFRGWLFSTLKKRPVLAVAVTTITFTLIHLLSNGGQQTALDRVLYLFIAFGFSLLGAGMLLWTNSLWAAVGVHGGLHLGNAAAEILLHQVHQPTSWVVVGGFHSLVGIVLIVTALRNRNRLAYFTEQ